MNTSGTIEWEWFAHWKRAYDSYFPRYAARGQVRGLFPVNVPYNFPLPALFAPGVQYLIDQGVVVFRPREWRGTGSPDGVPFARHNFLTPAQQAAELSALPAGSVTYIYITSDGGGDLQMIYDMVPLLAAHVQVVDHETLTELALQRG